MKYTKLMITIVAGLLVMGCSEGKYSGLSASELVEKKRKCDSVPKKSAVFANGCEQVSKEVAKRRAKK